MGEFRNIVLPGEIRRRQLFYLSKSKLTTCATLASFMDGFAIRSVVNLQINDNPDPILLTCFGVVTALLVSASSFVILVALWMLPLLKTAEEINGEIVHCLHHGPPSKIAAFDLSEFANGVQRRLSSATADENSTKNLLGLKTFRTNAQTVRYIEIAWILAGTLSVLLFMVDVIIMYWIKFEDFTWTGVVVNSVLLVCVMIGLGIFGLYFRLVIVQKFRNIAKKSNPYDHRNMEQNNMHNPSVIKNTRDNSLTSDLPPETELDSYHGCRNTYYTRTV